MRLPPPAVLARWALILAVLVALLQALQAMLR
jgi:hypothetical protein